MVTPVGSQPHSSRGFHPRLSSSINCDILWPSSTRWPESIGSSESPASLRSQRRIAQNCARANRWISICATGHNGISSLNVHNENVTSRIFGIALRISTRQCLHRFSRQSGIKSTPPQSQVRCHLLRKTRIHAVNRIPTRVQPGKACPIPVGRTNLKPWPSGTVIGSSGTHPLSIGLYEYRKCTRSHLRTFPLIAIGTLCN